MSLKAGGFFSWIRYRTILSRIVGYVTSSFERKNENNVVLNYEI